jgi:hypothetical protein
MLGCLVVSQAFGSRPAGWFQANVAHGEIDGYQWAVGAKGPRGEPLAQICAQVSLLEPSQAGADVVEGRDSIDCGSVKRPEESVSSSESFGSGESRVTVLETVYQPVVNKVTFTLATGERRSYRPRLLQIPHQTVREIPLFRYIVVSLKGEACIRRIATFNGHGSIVSSEVRPPCPAGTGNLG